VRSALVQMLGHRRHEFSDGDTLALTAINGTTIVGPSVDGPGFPMLRSHTAPRHPPPGLASVADVRTACVSPAARQGCVFLALQYHAAPVVRRPRVRGEALAVGAGFHGHVADRAEDCTLDGPSGSRPCASLWVAAALSACSATAAGQRLTDNTHPNNAEVAT
jgi:hypothetical protein